MARVMASLALLLCSTALGGVKASAVAGNVWVLESGQAGNIGVSVGDDGVFVIDDQLAPLAPKILAELKKLSKRPVRVVFNTHWHLDHAGANDAFAKQGAVIVAHENVRKRLSVDQMMELFGIGKVPAAPPRSLPVVTFTRDLTFWLNGDEVRVLHLPAAHTDGDAAVHFVKANVIHAGDAFINGGYPVIDLGSGGTAQGLIAAMDRLLELADDKTKIIPGHGPVGGKAELKAARDLLVAVRDRIAPLVKAGKTLSEIQAAKPTADLDAKHGQAFVSGELIVDMVARSLGAK